MHGEVVRGEVVKGVDGDTRVFHIGCVGHSTPFGQNEEGEAG